MSKKYEILDADERIEFSSIVNTINLCFGKTYGGWMQGTWPNKKPKPEDGVNFRAWFPKLSKIEDGVPAKGKNGCTNYMSPDCSELIFDDSRDVNNGLDTKYEGYDLIFAKDYGSKFYTFRGVFIFDKEKSTATHNVHKRVGTKVKILGDPAFDIQIVE